MIKQSLFILALLLMLSCSHTEDMINSRTFQAPREKVWKALVAVFKSYPLKTIDDQRGYIETKVLKANHFWKPPHLANQDFAGYSSVITVRLSYTKPLTTVFIDKKVYKQEGFISSKKKIPFDLLEEAVLFYRIIRELSVQSQLSRM